MGRWNLNKALKGAGKAMQGGAGIAGNIVGKAVDVSSSTIKYAAETGGELRNAVADEVSAVKRKTAQGGASTSLNTPDGNPANGRQTNSANLDPHDSKAPSITAIQGADIQEIDTQTESVAIDRQTQFAEGILTLTAEGLTLYNTDGQYEIIPVDIIATCSRGLRKNSLVVRRMTNINANFQRHMDKKRQELSELPTKVNRLKYRTVAATGAYTSHTLTGIKDGKVDMRNAGGAATASAAAMITGAYALKKSHDLKVLPSYLEHLELDIPTIVNTARKEADTKKESFHLPDGYTQEEAAQEYLIWEYLVNRRMSGTNINIVTTPPNAVVVVDGVVQGCTPLAVGLPLTDKIALAGKCTVSVLLEGHEYETLSLSPNKEYEYRKIHMKPKKLEDRVADQLVTSYRTAAPQRPIDMFRHHVEYEVVGDHGVLVIAQDNILMLTHDKKECICIIPYASVNEAKIMKKFARGVKGIFVSYNDYHFASLRMEFVIEQAEFGSEVKGVLEQIVEAIMARRGRTCPHTTEYHPPRDTIRNLRQSYSMVTEQSGTSHRVDSEDLQEKGLVDADLRGADLSGYTMSGYTLSGKDLSGTNLSGADLIKVDLTGANLSGARLDGTRLNGAKLDEANLIGANLSGADLLGASLFDADLRGADLSGASLDRTNLFKVDLSDVKLSEANLTGADLNGASLTGADLTGADLSGANLSGANLDRTNLSRANLTGVNLNGVNLSGAILDDSTEHV